MVGEGLSGHLRALDTITWDNRPALRLPNILASLPRLGVPVTGIPLKRTATISCIIQLVYRQGHLHMSFVSCCCFCFAPQVYILE